MPVPFAVTQKDAASLLGISTDHLARAIRRGEIALVDMFGAWRVPMSELGRVSTPPRMESSGATSARVRFDAAAAITKLKELRTERKTRRR
jgi:predicted site-specific integrase-resolvase